MQGIWDGSRGGGSKELRWKFAGGVRCDSDEQKMGWCWVGLGEDTGMVEEV